ncbi:alpha/beta hydrolase [Asanoa ishikariensis]|uniref:Pimeloyl-ACP methyl ester carboxylesterase n=1 Tax=Asanoa ishikariensis TaxID=137265 RepID=A0A1H3M2E7_9ACTN|nr:alpha/beta hydrolase [Asanoa ishikariensis]GIF65844.1 alpha/beta hydrolase [Asanoa ishikariensis]SDY70438.1 Pimeloyl-ACP methyl ester carboxylesterase [Asanoa ishikariensis]
MSTRRRAGIVGAVVGLAAAGIATGIAVERAVVRRSKRGVSDPYVDEPFDRLPYDESLVVTTADGTDIHVEVVEPTAAEGAKPTLVFVHGFCLDMGTFHFQRSALTARGEYRMVFYDQPGHGRSGRMETGEYELPALGETLHAVLSETVPDGPLILVGHSMGGMTIMAFAELYPEFFEDRVKGCVLIATSGGLIDETRLGLPALIGRVGGPLLPLVNSATRLTGPTIDRARVAATDLAWLLTRRYGFGESRPSPSLVSYVEKMNSRTSVDTVARYLRTLYTHARYPALAALERTPTVIIVGDKDMITPVAHSEEILRHLPDAEFVKVNDSGHVVMLEHADEVNATLTTFLEKISA